MESEPAAADNDTEPDSSPATDRVEAAAAAGVERRESRMPRLPLADAEAAIAAAADVEAPAAAVAVVAIGGPCGGRLSRRGRSSSPGHAPPHARPAPAGGRGPDRWWYRPIRQLLRQ